MILHHYSKEPTLVPYDRSMPLSDIRYYGKPNGLWLTDETDRCSWVVWCHDNDFGDYKYEYTIEVDLDNILFIDDLEKFDAFQEKYGFYLELAGLTNRYIDWYKVQQELSGVIITPYQWSKRLGSDSFWYYLWDCASGCVWDSTKLTVLSVKEIQWPIIKNTPRR